MASADYISREAAIRIASGYCHPANIAEELSKLPAADVRPVVKARWEKVIEQRYLRKHYHVVACSACHKRGNQGWNFCPNCGALMETQPEEE